MFPELLEQVKQIDRNLTQQIRPIGSVSIPADWELDDTGILARLPAGTLIERVIKIEPDRMFLQSYYGGLRCFAWIDRNSIGWFKNIPQI